ncbi:MAG TPA: DUF4145 domain-containing protein [Candidatus Solibacter sp.]|nr:DUF4145 domain-containing protein [Candidatus Solibacter sp.]
MNFQVKTYVNQQGVPGKISVRCPACKRQGTFDPLTNIFDVVIQNFTPPVVSGQRTCPNPECQALLFFVRQGEKILVSYPPELVDFDPVNLPAPVLSAFEEAISCHANRCFVAAAIMVRKTLEELCLERKATGNNLKDRIRALGTIVVLPKELLDGLDDLRLLGNDAAHIESQEFNKVGQEEVEIGIEFAKEVLKAVYQYSALLDRLRRLKKPSVIP